MTTTLDKDVEARAREEKRMTTQAIVEDVCYGCRNTGLAELHCDQDWRDCPDGPGLHYHLETCYVCGGDGGPITYEVAEA